MEQKKIVCDSDVMIDYWDAKNPRYDLVTSILGTNLSTYNTKHYKFISDLTLYDPA